uniref:Uncharacterized protein n=1 Tax=Rhizophagus irregularis (strain DAOM 181602 / DAOM 197198 / MUCL 43194) TaxID=747089 RepID=U9U094_RHIID
MVTSITISHSQTERLGLQNRKYSIRLIVLLETFRKLFVKILTQRINILLTSYNLINKNNHAGLIGQSTLQPLQVIQHIIESAYKDKKQLWIGLHDLSKANRKNNVILPSGLSTDYDVLQSIDQGETSKLTTYRQW